LVTTTAADTTTADLTLAPAEQAVLAAVIGPFAETLRDPHLRERYALLAEAVQAGAVPADALGLVEALAELLLPTQRVRREHGPEAERALAAVYDRTPRGEARRQAAREVNEALAALEGQTLAGLRFSATPAGHRLVVTTDRGQLQLTIDRAGVRVESVDLGSVSA
jgi:hypothetical protein